MLRVLRPWHKERANLGADEVVRATGAEVGEIFCVRGVDELEHVWRVAEAGDPAVLRTDAAAEIGRNLDSAELCDRRATGTASPPKRDGPFVGLRGAR